MILLWDLGAYPNELDKSIIDPSSMRKPEAASGAKLVEKEQFLLLGTLFNFNLSADLAVDGPSQFSCGLAWQLQRGRPCSL